MTAVFYLLTAFIWGSTWYGVKVHQMSTVPLALSNFYRFLIAVAVLYLYTQMRKKIWPKLFWRDHGLMALQGFFLFCLNYYCYMRSVAYVPSGLTSVAFSSIIVFNCAFSALFLKLPVTRQMMIGGFFGIAGLCVIFSGHLAHFQSGGLEIYGLLFAVGGAIASSFGHIIAKYAQMRGADVIQNCLYSMTYGVGWWGLFVLLSGESLTFEMSPSYISALLYLAVVGSTLAFIFFLILLRNIGPGRASYVFIISPVVALVVSSVMEGYVWSETLIIGLVFVMVGNILMLRRRS